MQGKVIAPLRAAAARVVYFSTNSASTAGRIPLSRLFFSFLITSKAGVAHLKKYQQHLSLSAPPSHDDLKKQNMKNMKKRKKMYCCVSSLRKNSLTLVCDSPS
jgi:hypothetical protein